MLDAWKISGCIERVCEDAEAQENQPSRENARTIVQLPIEVNTNFRPNESREV